MTNAMQQTAAELWRCGLNDRQISEKLGVYKATIQRFRRLNGMEKNVGTAARRKRDRERRLLDGELIKNYREIHNLTQTQFGDMFGIDFHLISAYENGKLNTPSQIIEHIFNEEFC